MDNDKGVIDIRKDNFQGIIEWFESHYNPGEKGENGNPRAAELFFKGVKSEIVIRIMYLEDARLVYGAKTSH